MYEHACKAGNRADVWKHFWLCEVVSRVQPRQSGKITILDTHCGAGLFHRDNADEWDRGVGLFGRSAAATLGKFGQVIAPYLDMSQYLGSWTLAASVLEGRHVDFEIHGCDLSVDVKELFEANALCLGYLHRCRFTRGDGYAVAERGEPHSLVFLDPPYSPDANTDWRALSQLIPTLQRSADVVAVWYPIDEGINSDQLLATCRLVGHEVIWGGTGMKGCGFGIRPCDELDLTEAEHTACNVARTLGGSYSKRVVANS